MNDSLRYPIGGFTIPEHIPDDLRQAWIQDIADFPEQIGQLNLGQDRTALNQTYRPGGWTVKQVIHHCADSHLNAVIRFKLAITEDQPTIRPYREDLWAELADGKQDDLSATLQLLTGLHGRWVILLKSLSKEELERKLIHPDFDEPWTVEAYIGNYAWHCRHHLAHIKMALQVD